jgi:Cu-Zn family superoxide dismutase
MMSTLRLAAMLFASLGLAASGVHAAETASATLKDLAGKTVGTALLRQSPNGTLVAVRFRGLPPGTHAFHIHAVGKCEPPFASAGGHYNPTGAKHGFLVTGGPHAGDMPNIHVGANGTLDIEVLNVKLALDGGLFDADGAAIVLHAKGDDYRSQPSGDAGSRIACGVITKK